MEKTKATLYINSEFFGCPQRLEIWLVKHGRMEYAQYKDAPFIKYIVKGKRKVRQLIKGYNPFMVIVKGWGTPESAPGWHTGVKKEGEIEIKESKYACHDERYLLDFNSWFATFKDLEIIADYRENKKLNEVET